MSGTDADGETLTYALTGTSAAPGLIRFSLPGLPAGKYRDQAMALMSRAPGKRDEAAAALARLETSASSPSLEGPQDQVMDVVRLAEIHVFDGRMDQAFATLTKKRDQLTRYPNANLYVGYLQQEARLSPFLKPLHADPRWAVFMDARG